jgi:Fungal specific transcription factor domain
MFTGVAIRQAQALRLGTEYNHRHSARQKETRRRTFWACFVMDRLISYCCSRPQMIDIRSVRVQLPCPETNFAFEQPYIGPGFDEILLSASQAPNLGVLPFLVATVRLWGDMAYLLVRDGRKISQFSPTDPRSEFYQLDKATDEISNALPSCLKWSPRNYKLYRSVGQARPYVNLHFLLHHAKCVMHSEYLPQSEKLIDRSDLDGEMAKDGAGLPFNHWDDHLIAICVTNAVAISDIAEFLYHGDAEDRNTLQSTFAACAMMSAVGVHLWTQYTRPHDEQMGSSPSYKSNMVLVIIRSWQTQWNVSVAWVETLQMLYKLYAASYGDLGWMDALSYMEQDAVNGNDNQPLTSEIVTDSEAYHAPSEGDGIPDPAVICRRLMDKVRLIMLLSLEATELKKRNLNSFLRGLWQHMWDHEALIAFGDMVAYPTPDNPLV